MKVCRQPATGTPEVAPDATASAAPEAPDAE